MKDISIGIYHKDHQYGKRLMEYLNHQKDFPMTASFTSDEEMFFKQEQEGDFECLVLAEETDYHGDFPVCRIGANESMGGMYCQSAKEIAAGIYHCLNVSPQIENERIFEYILRFQDWRYRHLQGIWQLRMGGFILECNHMDTLKKMRQMTFCCFISKNTKKILYYILWNIRRSLMVV